MSLVPCDSWHGACVLEEVVTSSRVYECALVGKDHYQSAQAGVLDRIACSVHGHAGLAAAVSSWVGSLPIVSGQVGLRARLVAGQAHWLCVLAGLLSGLQ